MPGRTATHPHARVHALMQRAPPPLGSLSFSSPDHISEYLSRLASAGCKCLDWQTRGPRDKGGGCSKMQSRSRLCLLAVSILGQSELLIYLFLFCLCLCPFITAWGFCNQSVWRNAPSLLLWRLNSARCQFEMNCEERSRRPACKGGGGGWAAVEEIRRNY